VGRYMINEYHVVTESYPIVILVMSSCYRILFNRHTYHSGYCLKPELAIKDLFMRWPLLYRRSLSLSRALNFSVLLM